MKNLSGTIMLPREYVVVNEEEMTYVEGGEVYLGYISNDICANIVGIVGSAVIAAGPEVLAGALCLAAQAIDAIPVVGTAIGIAVALGGGAVAFSFANALIGAYYEGKGIAVFMEGIVPRFAVD